MMKRTMWLCSLCALSVIALAVDASACGRRCGRIRGPLSTVFRVAIPSMNDIRAVPTVQNGQLLTYPLDVAAYGLNIHPGARVIRAVVRPAFSQ